jgi:hypothetical protein
MTLEPGLEIAFRYTVTEGDTAAALGSEEVPVVATRGFSPWPSGRRWSRSPGACGGRDHDRHPGRAGQDETVNVAVSGVLRSDVPTYTR